MPDLCAAVPFVFVVDAGLKVSHELGGLLIAICRVRIDTLMMSEKCGLLFLTARHAREDAIAPDARAMQLPLNKLSTTVLISP
jgi:hypothetical protein